MTDLLRRTVLFLGMLCLLTGMADAALATDHPVRYLGIEQGLSNNAVTSIYKDSHGFVWISTYDGLNRFDGSTVKIYRNVWGDNRSLNNNHLNRITGYGNRIYVGTQSGPMYYDYADARFHSILYQPAKGNLPQKITHNVNALYCGAGGKLYIGTDYAGLFICNPGDSVARQITLDNANTWFSVQAIAADKYKQVWLFIRDVGLCRLNTPNHIEVIDATLKSANCLLIDAYGKIWIGTDNGLFVYNRAAKSISRVINSALTSENVVDLRFSRSRQLWIGTNGGGVNIMDTTSHRIRHIVSGNENGSLHSDAISMIYEDNGGLTWVATLRGGVNIIDNNPAPFKLITHDPFNKNSVVNNFALSFCEDEAHNLWIGTDGGGLSYWNRKADQYTSYVHSASSGSLSSNFVVSVLKDKANQIWVATFSGGIDRFNKTGNSFIHYTCYNPYTKTEDKSLWKLFLDSRGDIWAGTTRGGALYKYNRATDRFEVFDKNLINIHALFEDSKGNLWAGDYSRLIKIDIANKNHQYTEIKNAVRSINQDRQGRLWLGTEGGGLISYDSKTQAIKRYTRADGLPSNSVLNVLVDNNGNLWGSTYNGLTEYNTATGKFKNFYAADGLQSNQFNFNAALKLQSGELAFGGINGFNLFYPDSVKLAVHQPQLTFTGLRISNKNVEGTTNYTGNQAIVDLKEISVPYDQATLAVDYTALEYSFPDKISYSYYLDNWDHGWNNVGTLKTAYYTRLNEGTYTLYIRATNTAGNWSDNQLRLKLIVLPPWYRTWWAWLLYISAICAVIYWYWQYRIRQTHLQYEIEIANLKVEKEKEANEKKLSFFTNVSHEFRTPLTLIINPIKDLLRQDKTHNEELNIVYRNARRLLGLVDHLLLFRKTESENADLKVSKVNFADLSRDVYTCFLHQAKIKNISYQFENASDQIELYVDREKIEIALFNLISNAVKFTPDGGSIHINIKQDERFVYFEITDSGIGITAEVGERLFDKFYQVKDANSLKTGFGIGLYLVKTFMESHSGTINYKSTAGGGGTTFTLCLPKGKEHLGAYPIVESATEGYSYAAEELIDYDNTLEKPLENGVTDLNLLISDKQSVLVIDDNNEIRTYIKKIFAAEYEVFEAENGERGLELIKKHLPDVIISDIVMPGLSGMELIRIVKQDSTLSHIPIILLTGEAAPAIRLQGIEEGAVDFMNKPFDKDLLVARVKGIIKNKSELQNYFFSEITLKGKSRNVSEEHKDFLYRCIEIIENSLTDPELEVNAIADKMGMSYSSLYKKIRQVTGQSINGFIRFVRLRKAAELMINTNCNVNEAAFRVGFNDIKYFREHFHKQFGINPSEFIKQHRVAFQKSYSLKQRKVKG
ncbi:response regulator [Mucilaginibacter mali]|uniref:histidine kinase n=1 Tax=Mucilaginibacter mali TaxID=2740462 RepID=A0A7D4Q2B8_9SPHI|nr:two-component regulator propeller domain-containing protein [Mucilaginibacter mali]QKJ29527.1 response regulator [Mucilaginibacter mali]